MVKLNKITRAVSSATALLIASSVTHAAVLEETIVTDAKREQSMQDVGISVTAYSGEQMKALGVTNTI